MGKEGGELRREKDIWGCWRVYMPITLGEMDMQLHENKTEINSDPTRVTSFKVCELRI